MLRKGKEKKEHRQQYGSTGKRKNSKMGVRSCIYAAAALFLLVGSVAISFAMHGKAAFFIGIIGIGAVVCAGLGIVAAIKGMRERNRRYVNCRIGLFFNILAAVSLIIIFIGGF
jgi:hypothetical protein